MKKQLVSDIKRLLKTLRKDAEMALSGEWDCTTTEGQEGFQCQIDSIDNLLYKIKLDDTRTNKNRSKL